jgi:putative PEP-CTERM system TPR-repeat lipoprotein
MKYSITKTIISSLLLSQMSIVDVASAQDSAVSRAELSQPSLAGARALFSEGKIQEAIQLLKALEEISEDPSTHLEIASIYNDLQDGIAAEIAVERAIELGADLDTARVYKAKALLTQGKFQTTLALFRAFEIPDALKNEGLQTQAESFFGAGDYKAAQQTFLKVLDGDPDNLEALKGLAHVALQTGNLDAAKNIADKANTIDENDTLVHYILGAVSRFQGDMTAARASLTKSIEIFPQNVLSLMELAAIEVAEGQYEAADQVLDQVYGLYPEHPQAIFISAQIEALKGEYNEAEVLLIKLANYAEAYPPVYYLRGIVAFRLGNYSTAASNLQNFLDVVPAHRETRLVLADSLKNRRLYREALDTLMPIVGNEQSEDFDALMLAASVASSAGNADDGLKYLMRASQINEASGKGVVDKAIDKKLVYSNFLAGNFETAEKLLRQIQTDDNAEGNPEDTKQDLVILANIQMRKQEYDQALTTVQNLIEIAPDDHEAFNLLAGVHSRLGQVENAIEAYSKAISLNGDYTVAIRNRALMQLRLGKLADASKDLSLVLEKQPEDVRARAIIGRVELLQKNYSVAARHLEVAADTYPESYDVRVDYIDALYNAGYVSKALAEAEKVRKARFASRSDVLEKRFMVLWQEISEHKSE